MIKFFYLLCLLFFICGCGSPTLDQNTVVYPNDKTNNLQTPLGIEKEFRTMLGDSFLTMALSKNIRYAFVARKNQNHGTDLEKYEIIDDQIKYRGLIRSFEEDTTVMKILSVSNSLVAYFLFYGVAASEATFQIHIYDFFIEREINRAYLQYIHTFDDAYVSDDGKYIYFSNHNYYLDISHPYSVISEVVQ